MSTPFELYHTTNTVPERQNFRTKIVLRVINFVKNVFVSIVHSNFLKWILNGILGLFISLLNFCGEH